MKKIDTETNIFGLQIFSSEKYQLLEVLETHLIKNEKTMVVFTPNPEQVVLANRSKIFAKTLGSADILVPDGVGLVFASRFLHKFDKSNEISERIAGIDLVVDLLKFAKQQKLKIMIIGGRDYEGREFKGRAVKILELSGEDNESEHATDFLWWEKGFLDVSNPTKGESSELISDISRIKPDIVFVAFGAPYQERWITENLGSLNENNVSLAMAVGGTFDVLLGKVPRAPKMMQNLGLEWLYRLIEEPWRWRRQLRLLEFMGLVIKEAFSK